MKFEKGKVKHLRYKFYLIHPFLRFFGFPIFVAVNSFLMAVARVSKLGLFIAPLKFLIVLQSDFIFDSVLVQENPTFALAILMGSIAFVYIGSVSLSRKLSPVLYGSNKYKSRMFLQVHNLPAKEKYFLSVQAIVVDSATTILEIFFYLIVAFAFNFHFLSMFIVIFCLYSVSSRFMLVFARTFGFRYRALLPIINSFEFVFFVIIAGALFESNQILIPEFALMIFVMRRILLSVNGVWSMLLEPVSDLKRSFDLE